MSQRLTFATPPPDLSPGLVVTGFGVVASEVEVVGAPAAGVLVSDDGEPEAAPPDEPTAGVLVGVGDSETLVVLLRVGAGPVVDVELAALTSALAASKGSRVWLVGVLGWRAGAWEW